MVIGEKIVIPTPAPNPERQQQAFSWYLQHGGSASLAQLLAKSETPVYKHWVKIRFSDALPQGLSAAQCWEIIKLSRTVRARTTPLRDEHGRHFKWVQIADHQRFLHQLDLNTGGKLLGLENLDNNSRRRFIASSLMEEAIASSQMEGAHTTRKEARRLILENREPINKDQRMIINNHKTMEAIESEFKYNPLSIDLIFEMHRMLTQGAIDAGSPGAFRKDTDDIYVSGGNSGQIAHIPPAMSFVENEMTRLIAYANTPSEDETDFVHPVIKAISLHFWIGYLHPFGDGNGRLARSVFYWYLLRNGYWAFAFLPISTRIKLSAKSYGKAYLYTEQDDNDLTYFIDYNLRQIRQSIRDFQRFYEDRKAGNAQLRKLSRSLYGFNERQIGLIKYMWGDHTARTNVSSYQQIHGISQMTAIKDLKSMVENDFLLGEKQGRNVFYYPTEKLLNLTRSLEIED